MQPYLVSLRNAPSSYVEESCVTTQRKPATEANVTHRKSYPTRYRKMSDATRKKLLAMMYLSKNEIALVLKTLPHDSYVTLQENFKFSAHQSKLGASRDE